MECRNSSYASGSAVYVLLSAIVATVAAIAATIVYFMHPIDTQLINGDWLTLICYLNKVTIVRPENRPILIIRELVSMDNETLFACLSVLERIKENGSYYVPGCCC